MRPDNSIPCLIADITSFSYLHLFPNAAREIMDDDKENTFSVRLMEQPCLDEVIESTRFQTSLLFSMRSKRQDALSAK